MGTCTDVALYVMHAGGRIIPMPKDLDKYDAACGARTARMLLETMYSEFVSKSPQVLYLHLLNSEHMWQVDEAMHSKVDVFLCKTRFCATLLRAHIAKKRWRSSVRLMGHSSSDPLVDLPFDMRRVRAGEGVGRWGAAGGTEGLLGGHSGCRQEFGHAGRGPATGGLQPASQRHPVCLPPTPCRHSCRLASSASSGAS